MFCPVTKKRTFESEVIALEALVQNHIQNFHLKGGGPINVYQCDHCGNWHFTSKGSIHPELESSELKDRIRKERLGQYWERKLR